MKPILTERQIREIGIPEEFIPENFTPPVRLTTREMQETGMAEKEIRKAKFSEYAPPEELEKLLFPILYKKKFRLPCGHLVTFNESFGAHMAIRNRWDNKLVIECGDCHRW